MKKVLLIVMMIFACVSGINAQAIAKYQGELDFGYSVGTGTFSTGRVNIHTIHGAKIGEYFSAGLGLGVDYYHEFYNMGELYMPIFLNMKGYIPVTDKLSPFASLDMGYGVGVTSGVTGTGGFLWSPSVGLRYNKFKFQFGYTSQRISKYGFGVNMNAVQFKIGVIF